MSVLLPPLSDASAFPLSPSDAPPKRFINANRKVQDLTDLNFDDELKGYSITGITHKALGEGSPLTEVELQDAKNKEQILKIKAAVKDFFASLDDEEKQKVLKKLESGEEVVFKFRQPNRKDEVPRHFDNKVGQWFSNKLGLTKSVPASGVCVCVRAANGDMVLDFKKEPREARAVFAGKMGEIVGTPVERPANSESSEKTKPKRKKAEANVPAALRPFLVPVQKQGDCMAESVADGMIRKADLFQPGSANELPDGMPGKQGILDAINHGKLAPDSDNQAQFLEQRAALQALLRTAAAHKIREENSFMNQGPRAHFQLILNALNSAQHNFPATLRVLDADITREQIVQILNKVDKDENDRMTLRNYYAAYIARPGVYLDAPFTQALAFYNIPVTALQNPANERMDPVVLAQKPPDREVLENECIYIYFHGHDRQACAHYSALASEQRGFLDALPTRNLIDNAPPILR